MSEKMSGPTSQIYFSQRLRLHYVDWGNEGAPPLLLIHGGRDHCRNWDWVAQALRHDYHIIAPDLRGHGDSQWAVGGSYAIADFVYDIQHLLKQKNLTPVSVIAHSMGGAISLLYTGAFPETVKKLVVIEGIIMSPRRIRETAQHAAARTPVGLGRASCTTCRAGPRANTKRRKKRWSECAPKIRSCPPNRRII